MAFALHIDCDAITMDVWALTVQASGLRGSPAMSGQNPRAAAVPRANRLPVARLVKSSATDLPCRHGE
jgi:hypothetical protein